MVTTVIIFSSVLVILFLCALVISKLETIKLKKKYFGGYEKYKRITIVKYENF